MQNQPLAHYDVTLYHDETQERVTVGVIANNEQGAKSHAKHYLAMLLGGKWMLSRTTVLSATVRALAAAALLFTLISCTSSTGGGGSPSLTCEQRFDRALERGTPYTEALGDYTECLIQRGDRLSVQEAVSL